MKEIERGETLAPNRDRWGLNKDLSRHIEDVFRSLESGGPKAPETKRLKDWDAQFVSKLVQSNCHIKRAHVGMRSLYMSSGRGAGEERERRENGCVCGLRARENGWMASVVVVLRACYCLSVRLVTDSSAGCAFFMRG